MEPRLAKGVFDRLKTLLLALDRQDRLETAQAFVGWLQSLPEDAHQVDEMALHMVLRAFRAASDPVNFRLLRRLREDTAVALPALMAEVGLGRVPVYDRVSELMQAGLVVQELESEDVRITPLGEGLVDLVEAIRQDVVKEVLAWLVAQPVHP